jgi:hypothetical protein
MVVEALIELDVSVPTIVSVYVPFVAYELDELLVELLELVELLVLPQPDAANPIATRRKIPVNMRMDLLRKRQPSRPAPSKPAIARLAGAVFEVEGGGALLLPTLELVFRIFRLPLPLPVTEALEQSDSFV